MSEPQEQSQLAQGLAALRAGDKATAQSLLREVVKQDPRIIEAWMGLAQTTDDPGRQRACYENVLKIDPDHAAARAGLATLAVSAPDAAPPAGETIDSLRAKAAAPSATSRSFKPPQGIPDAPASFSLDDLLTVNKNLLASLQGTAGRGGNAEALIASWWNATVLVVTMGVLTGLIAAIVGLIRSGGFGVSPLALLTLPVLMTLSMVAGLSGAVVFSRWFLAWRGVAPGNLLDHSMALIRPWFGGSAATLVILLIGGLAGAGVTSLDSLLLYFRLSTSGFSLVLLIISIVVAIGVLYLTERGWAKLYPESKALDRYIAALVSLLIISIAVL